MVGGRPGRPGAAPRGEVGGGRAPRHRAGHAGTHSRGQRAALEGRAQTCWTWTWTWTWVGEFWWFEKRSAQSVVARNAMPPPGDTDGAVRSDEAGEAPHSVVVLPATSDLSSTLRPLVERERSERGDEDGAVGVVGGGLVASSTTRRRRMRRRRRVVTVILGPRPMSYREEVTSDLSAPSQRGSIVDGGVHGDGMVRRHAGQAAIAHASA